MPAQKYFPARATDARRHTVRAGFFGQEIFDYSKPPRNTSAMSPYAVLHQLGIAPADMPSAPIIFKNGVPTIDGLPLGYGEIQSGITGAPVIPKESAPVYIDGQYGDSVIFPVAIAAGIPVKVLVRPSNQRVMLLVQSQFLAGNLFYQFNKAADGFSSIAIVPFGNRLWDNAVPQGDLWLYSAVNGLAVIEYMNKDITSVS